jgi:hypothetical protein
MKSKKKVREGSIAGNSITPSHSEAPEASSSRSNAVNHSLDLVHGFTPVATSRSVPVRSMRLHGRPLELACDMLAVAYSQSTGKGKRKIMLEDVDLHLDPDMRSRLAPGCVKHVPTDIRYSQLRSYHPHLETLPRMLHLYAESNNPCLSLLFATSLYLSTLALPSDDRIRSLRTALAPYIYHLRDTVLLHLTPNFQALQGLDLLILHAPLGVLPLQLADPRHLAVARGQVNAIKVIAESLSFDVLFRTVIQGGLSYAFNQSDIWLYLGMVAMQGEMALQDETCNKPAALVDARHIAEGFLADTQLWHAALDVPEVIGKLSVCDRLIRLDDVHNTLMRIQQALEGARSGKDMVSDIVYEFEQHCSQTKALTERHDALLSLYGTTILTPDDIGRVQGAGWAIYRALHQYYESCKIYLLGLRCFMAVHYLPGSYLAYPDLPDLAGSEGVSYAISRACNPGDIMRVAMDTSPASFALNEWGTYRGEVSQHLLTAFTTRLEEANSTLVVPIHQVIAIALEAGKVLMEMQAGTVIALRARDALHVLKAPAWLPTMRKACRVMRDIGLLAVEEKGEGESIANGCSNIMGSMIRTADEWIRAIDSERSQMEEQKHGYMNTSDRWMSAPTMQTPLDHLLSETYGYSQ